MVKEIKTKQEFDEIISQSKLVVVDFTATWCGPCQRIAPVFSDLAEANPEVEFIKVDVDANEEVASACAIQSMPTFHFYKNGEKVFAFSGASAQTLAEKVLEYK